MKNQLVIAILFISAVQLFSQIHITTKNNSTYQGVVTRNMNDTIILYDIQKAIKSPFEENVYIIPKENIDDIRLLEMKISLNDTIVYKKVKTFTKDSIYLTSFKEDDSDFNWQDPEDLEYTVPIQKINNLEYYSELTYKYNHNFTLAFTCFNKLFFEIGFKPEYYDTKFEFGVGMNGFFKSPIIFASVNHKFFKTKYFSIYPGIIFKSIELPKLIKGIGISPSHTYNQMSPLLGINAILDFKDVSVELGFGQNLNHDKFDLYPYFKFSYNFYFFK